MGRVRFMGWEKVRTTFSHRDVVPGSTNYVDPGTCLNTVTIGRHEGDFAKHVHQFHTFPFIILSFFFYYLNAIV